MRFVDDIKDAWKWFSIQLMGAALVWEVLPEDAKEKALVFIPDAIEPYITSALVLAAIVGRMIKQKPDDQSYTQ